MTTDEKITELARVVRDLLLSNALALRHLAEPEDIRESDRDRMRQAAEKLDQAFVNIQHF